MNAELAGQMLENSRVALIAGAAGAQLAEQSVPQEARSRDASLRPVENF
jgi:hypothetical protein